MVTKKVVYHLFDDEVELFGYVFLSYLKWLATFGGNLFVRSSCDEELTNLAKTINKLNYDHGKDGVVRVLSPVTAAEIQAVEKERKAKNILLMAIPKEHMRRFHGMDDAKEIWEAIRTRFCGYANSKKMQKAVFKQQFEAFKISNSEGLEKGYDRFQQLLSQLEAHGAEVSTEDANHKFLRSLPSAWSNLAMTMRTNPEIDNLSIDDLYNNLRVFEQEIQGASKTSSSAQNVAFVSQSKSSTNKVKSGFSGAYSSCTPSTSSTNIPEKEVLAGFADEVIYSLFAKQTEDLDLLHEDLEQIDDVDIEEMDINWQIAMIAIRMKKFYKKTGRRVRVDGKTPVGFDKKKLECFNCHNTGHFAREYTAKGIHDGKKKRDSLYQHQEAGKQEKNQMGLLTMDDGIVNWGEHTEAEETNHALMAISSSNEVSLCSKTCIDSYNKLKLLYDEQMNQLGDQEAQILAYSQAVKKLEAQLVTSQKQQLSLNEKLAFQANEIHEKDEKLKRYRRIGMKAVKEKEQLQKTVDSWKDSSKNLWKLINSGMSSSSKIGLGYEIKSNDEVLSYEEEMNFSVFKCSKEDSIGKPSYNRFTKTNDFKGVPPPLSGDYTPTPQEEIDDSLYVYGKKGPQKPEISVSDENSSEHSSCQSNDSEGSCENISEHSFETESESLSEPNEMSKSRLEVTNEKDVSAPKSKEVEPSCVSHIKTPRQPLKDKETHKVNRKNWNDMMERELGEGYSFTKKKCFVCGSLSHLIKDCDYYEKKMAREAEYKLNAGWQNFNSVRPNINTGRTNINSVRSKVNAVSSKVNTVRSKQQIEVYYDSGCSGHLRYKDQLEEFEEFKGDCYLWRSLHHNMYSFDMKTPSPAKGFACLIAKATSDESKLWHRRLGHINFKNLNKLVKGNLVRGLPSKVFKNDHTCVATIKAEHTRASCKAKLERLITVPLHTLHMDLFGPTSVKSINHASYCLIENQLSHRVKIIRSDNGTEFKNRDMLEFCGNKGIKQEYSTARTPQQNGVAERMNRTLIEAARTMLADSLLPTTFWAEAVNTLSVLGKFDGKSDEGFLVGYSLNSKAYRVYNLVTKRVEVNLHVNFLEDKPNVKGAIQKVTDRCRRELEEIALKALGTVLKITTTSTHSVNTGSQKYSPKSQILGDPKSAVQTRSKVQNKSGAHALLSHIQKQQRNNHKDQQHCLFACFLSQEEPKKIAEALQDDSWVQAMQKNCYSSSYNKNKARLVAQGYTPSRGIDYDEVFAPVARIEAIRLFLAFASFMGFIVYQMDVKSAFLYGTIDEEISNGVPWVILTFFFRSQVKQKQGGNFISQDKYVAEDTQEFDLVIVKAAITKKPHIGDQVAFDKG
ncbi:putative ribonuclease H-like domain-containing protein [Tanacetum coccineum]